MKKTIQKPENWQDFETLCKHLWGEIWGIPMKIKKNGRNGQLQAGVDIYGVPKGELNYWGIQCKGKDDYVKAKLTKKEIDTEIDKAHNFKPDLSVFIVATTMNKDSDIEEYVRIKDCESKKNGKFEILLFCWEDITDLIDENQDTYNFWVGNKQHKTKYDFEVSLNNFQATYIIKPKCIKTIKKYKLKKAKVENLDMGLASSWGNSSLMHKIGGNNSAIASISRSSQEQVNGAICSFKVIMANTGSNVIENWRVRFTVVGEHKKIMNHLEMDISPIISHQTTYVVENQITYSPRDDQPLIQKDNNCFEAYIIPKCKEYTIPIEWEMLARDFNSSGIISLKVEPEYKRRIIYEEVDSREDLKEDEIISVEENIIKVILKPKGL